MFHWFRKLFTVRRPVTRTTRGGVTHTHAGLQIAFSPSFVFGAAPKPAQPARKPPTGTRLTNALLGPPTRPATLAEVRRRSVDTLTAAQAVTGQTYPTRHEVLAARQTAARRAVDGAARVVAPRLAKQSTMQAPGRKPIKVKAHTRADGTKVHAHTRAVPGKGTK
jgi:hypothetical protein